MTLAKVLRSANGPLPVHHAMNPDGTWFRRVLDRGKWTDWMVSAAAPLDAVKTTLLARLPAGNHTVALAALAA
jgi:hypothetical protein